MINSLLCDKCGIDMSIKSAQVVFAKLNNSFHTLKGMLVVITFTVTMSSIVKATLLFLVGAKTLSATALDDYVWKADEHYGWVDMVRLLCFASTCQPTRCYTLHFVFSIVLSGSRV